MRGHEGERRGVRERGEGNGGRGGWDERGEEG